MSSNSTHEFISPIGGVPYEIDFAPSVLFTVLYALLVPLTVRRMVNPKTRNIVVVGTTIFGIERVISFALRAAAARNASIRTNLNIETWFQTDYSGGFISIGQDLTMLLRAYLVDTTLGSGMRTRYNGLRKSKSDAESDSRAPLSDGNQGFPDNDGSRTLFLDDGATLEDHPLVRSRVRRLCGIVSILYWVTTILGIVAGADYKNAVESGAHAALVRQLWYGSIGLSLFLFICVAVGAVWASYRIPRVRKAPIIWIVLITIPLCIVAIYRLDVMRFSTTSLYSQAPGSQNSARDKALFYVLHIAPEYLAVAALTLLNVRSVFSTGLWGDRLYADPKPKDESK